MSSLLIFIPSASVFKFEDVTQLLYYVSTILFESSSSLCSILFVNILNLLVAFTGDTSKTESLLFSFNSYTVGWKFVSESDFGSRSKLCVDFIMPFFIVLSVFERSLFSWPSNVSFKVSPSTFLESLLITELKSLLRNGFEFVNISLYFSL